MAWKRLQRTTAFSCPYYKVVHDRILLTEKKKQIDYFFVAIPDSVMIIALTPKKEIVLVRQYRYPTNNYFLELPCGGDEGKKPLPAAKRELREEAGVRAKTWKRLGGFVPYNGVSNEFCHVFLATDLTFGDNDPEVTEDLTVVKIPASKVLAMIAQGKIQDGMTLAALHLFFNQSRLWKK